MATDGITGIKIGNSVYRENRTYRGGGAITDLLGKVNLGALTPGRFDAEIDITGRRLTLFISTTISSLPSKLKVVFAGDAIISPDNAKRAEDFSIDRVGAAVYANAGFIWGPTEAVGNTRTKPDTSLNKAFRGLLKDQPVLRNARLSTAKVYSMGLITGQIAPKLDELNIATTTDRNMAAGPFAAAFSNQPTQEWWNAGV